MMLPLGFVFFIVAVIGAIAFYFDDSDISRRRRQ